MIVHDLNGDGQLSEKESGRPIGLWFSICVVLGLVPCVGSIAGLVGLVLLIIFLIVLVFLVPFAAGNFIYIAASDLIPEMHKAEGWDGIKNIAVFFVGLALMWMLKAYGAG